MVRFIQNNEYYDVHQLITLLHYSPVTVATKKDAGVSVHRAIDLRLAKQSHFILCQFKSFLTFEL